MIKLRFLYLLLIPVIMFVAGCSKDDETPVVPPVTVNESEVLISYLEGSDGGFINTLAPAMISASALNTDMLAGANIAIIDIRSATDYAAGHIQGSVNVAVADLLTYYQSNNLSSKTKVVLACYSGQTAGFATSVLRLAGYSNVFDLKWGMCSWAYPTSWNNAKTNGQNNPITKQMTANVKNNAGNLPTLSTGKKTGTEILASRLSAVLAEGFSAASINRTTLYANLSNYYIVNYWPVAEYDLGHVEGAIQYTPKQDLKFATFIKTLPTDKPIVLYCYTGQTSAHLATYLRLLGYDAKSLLFGANNLFYDTTPSNKWVESECMNYPVVQ